MFGDFTDLLRFDPVRDEPVCQSPASAITRLFLTDALSAHGRDEPIFDRGLVLAACLGAVADLYRVALIVSLCDRLGVGRWVDFRTLCGRRRGSRLVSPPFRRTHQTQILFC